MIANEVLDNLPVHLLEFRTANSWSSTFMQRTRDWSSFRDRSPIRSSWACFRIPASIPPMGTGSRWLLRRTTSSGPAPRPLRQDRWSFVDYGLTWRDLANRPAGTLVSYSDSGADERVLDRPGEKDITSHANWDVGRRPTLRSAGFEVSAPTPQREVLNEFGLPQLEESLSQRQRDLTAEGRGAEALRTLSRRQALGVLGDPNGLGGLEVVIGRRNA